MDLLDQLLTRRVAKVLPNKEGLKRLLQTKKIRLYQGFDPTGSRLHLGHTIGLRKLMDFANLGHEVIFLFGTGTVLVGDPSQRSTARKLITQEEIDQNIKDWQKQVQPIVDFDKVTIKQNGDWLTPLTLKDIIHIASNISAIQLFKRDMFQRRLDQGDTIWYHETMYPLLQGYDSVAMDVDLEIGGTDQEFNMLIGRELLHKMKHKDKFVLTVPMILGTDGQQMSKTTGNCVWLDDTPQDMFGKIMSLPDTQIQPYWELVTNLPLDQLTRQPLADKQRLAFEVVKDFHGAIAAQTAQSHFATTVQQGQAPQDIPTFKLDQLSLKATIIDLLATAKLVDSRGEAKRLVEQGGISLNDQPVTDINQTVSQTGTLKVGKRHWLKLV